MITPDLSSFNPPEDKDFDGFVISKLVPADAKVDYEAIINNAASIRKQLGITWPTGNETFEDNLAQLKDHEKDFDSKKAFAYSIWDPERKKYLGCLYFYFKVMPWFREVPEEADAVVEVWVIEEMSEREKLRNIVEQIQSWVEDDWPLKSPMFVNGL